MPLATGVASKCRRSLGAFTIAAAALLSRLSQWQWHDAFLAGGFSPVSAQPFLAAIESRLAQAANVGAAAATDAERPR